MYYPGMHGALDSSRDDMPLASCGFFSFGLSYSLTLLIVAWVHHGFYYTYHNITIQPRILDAVIRTKDL
ncbi:hypothetical protein EUGRSUZ_H03719 [Eucalyptus grandis]|uniref:Uncharacterized protein n=3 Tax=Eucalyptus grandis TaxID=71139 RepID=A0A059B4E5_EUCGR|nr:hypothetical protein EUGRSUZ_H03719 [Eucalyptus grandis]KAK3417767.1 hypothetical protein EUGRSUZ_H03719 [Eucalyptus grandis]